MLSISTSSSGSSNSARTLPPLRIPDLDQDSATSSSSAAAAVPFPRISQRRKLYRGVGTQPWHNKGSDSDSDSESRKSKSKVAAASATTAPSHPNPETMPNFDPKRTYSESQITTPNPSLLSSIYGTPLIRKKSGEVVKSSLKSPKSPRNSSFGTSSGSFSSQGSLTPLTPTLKNSVHFDGQLEHVRLFHKEQKPAAVSRDGSPCDTETSDNDALGQSDGVYRSSEDERMRSTLVLEAINIPLRNAMASTQERLGDLDIRLEQVVLSKDGRAVEGTVLVRNIAFEKWVAVRFTYDWWQTTSEVTAKHSKSIPEENTDLFSFSIRLPEVTKRIEEKRLFFALRYLAAGREAWDNNRGENYQLRFRTEKKVKAPVQRTSPTHPPSWPLKSANVDQMADLRKELERVVREDDESNGVQSWDVLTVKLRAKNMHIEEDRAAKKESNFGSRYDFGASSKVKWEPPKELPKYGGPPPETMAVPFPSLRPTHTKAASISGSPSLQAVSWRSPRGSPRDTGVDSAANSPKFFIDPREAKHSAGTRQRHHQRGGYFDSYMEGNNTAVLTPTTGEALEMTPSTSTSSTDTVTPAVLVTEDNNEVSSETESTSSSTESSVDATGEQAQSYASTRTPWTRHISPLPSRRLGPSHPPREAHWSYPLRAHGPSVLRVRCPALAAPLPSLRHRVPRRALRRLLNCRTASSRFTSSLLALIARLSTVSIIAIS